MLRLRELFGPDALLKEAREVDRKAARDSRDLAIAYSCLVALTMYEPAVVRVAVAGVTFQNLTWADNIISRATESFIVTTYTTLRGRPKITVPAGSNEFADRSTGLGRLGDK